MNKGFLQPQFNAECDSATMQSPRSSCFGNTAYRIYIAELLRIGSRGLRQL